MKQKEIVAKIAQEIEAGNKDRNAIALMLLQEGCSLSAIQNGMRKAWKDAGISSHTPAASLTSAREDVQKDERLTSTDTYKDLREWMEELAEEHEISEKNAKKVIVEALDNEGFTIPRRINLGVVKESIVEYFCGGDHTDFSIENLAEYLGKRHEDIDEKRILTTARSNFSFAYLLYTNKTVEDIN